MLSVIASPPEPLVKSSFAIQLLVHTLAVGGIPHLQESWLDKVVPRQMSITMCLLYMVFE